MNLAAGDLRLQSNSPCINAGRNDAVNGGTDLHGSPRIANGTVDMGAYEFQSPTSAISYSWLQRYGFADDGSSDFADPDSDQMNNYQEWRCQTDPTNSLSLFRMLAPLVTSTNVVVRWESVPKVNYVVERSLDSGGPLSFTAIGTNIIAEAAVTAHTSTNRPSERASFYRVSVR